MDRQSHLAHSDDLNAFVDNTLTVEERARVESLLKENPLIQQELAELQATTRLLAQLPVFTPRRSFRLGEEFAKAPPVPEWGRILQFVPIVRALSVAATLVFMVVAGSLFFDINGTSDSDAGTTFQVQNEIMGNTGETESGAGSSDEAEDAGTGNGESSMTSRGDAASAGDAPMEDLTRFEESGDDVAQTTISNALASPAGESDDDDRSSWIWSSVIIGGLALALAGLWFGFAKVGRQSSAIRS